MKYFWGKFGFLFSLKRIFFTTQHESSNFAKIIIWMIPINFFNSQNFRLCFFFYFQALQIVFITYPSFKVISSGIFSYETKFQNSFDETSHLIPIEHDEDWELEIFASVLECVQHQNCCSASFSFWVWAVQLGFLARRRGI